MSKNKPKMTILAAQSQTLATLCKGQTIFWRQHGFDVDVIARRDKTVGSVIEEGAEFFHVNFVRQFKPFNDFLALLQIIRLFICRKPDIVQLMTSKPCLLGAIAAKLIGVPVVVRHKWGYVSDCDLPALKRFLFFFADKLSNKLANRVVAICHKLKDSEIKRGAVSPSKIVVYGAGSDNGVDLIRFRRTQELVRKGREIRNRLNIQNCSRVIGTVMRISIEKGIRKLVEAFIKLQKKIPHLVLLIVGEYDDMSSTPREVAKTIEQHPQIHCVGFQENVEDYYAAMDIFVMPSYREGFCKSNIEASSMQLPVVATDIIGCSESVLDGVTGLLVPVRNSTALADAIEKVLTDPQLAKQLGENGRARVEREFDQKLVWHNQLRDFCLLLETKGIIAPVKPDMIIGIMCPMCREWACQG